MCNQACIDFGISALSPSDIAGKRVLEVGSLDVNGSLRSIIEKLNPREYVGVDILNGPGVDLVCSAENIVSQFGPESFDIVISTELLEHARHWQVVISNFKNILKPGGILLLTTRSKGFPFHGYPFDFWRFESEDMKNIFSDLQINAIEKDSLKPGIFIKATKPWAFSEKNLNQQALFSVIKNKVTTHISNRDITLFKIKYQVHQQIRRALPTSVKSWVKSLLNPTPVKTSKINPVSIEKSPQSQKQPVRQA